MGKEKTGSFYTFFDLSVVFICILFMVSFYDNDGETSRWAAFAFWQHIGYIAFTFYMTARLYLSVVGSQSENLYESQAEVVSTLNVPEQTHVIWTSRSAAQASSYMPILKQIIGDFQAHWSSTDGHMNGKHIQSVTLYITDPNQAQCDRLKAEFDDGNLPDGLELRFNRCDFQKVIHDHCEILCKGDDMFGPRVTSTVFCFCGSPQLGAYIDACLEKMSWMLELSNNKHHALEFSQENLGHGTPFVKTQPPAAKPNPMVTEGK